MPGVLLCGRSGTGKTARVLAEVRDLLHREEADGSLARFVLLVPTYSRAEHLKRRLIRTATPLHAGIPGGDDGRAVGAGFLDRGVGTFEQLAERETGVHLSELAPPAAREALLAEALAAVDAPVFRPVARFAGFRRSALRFLAEVKAGEANPGAEQVGAAADRLRAVAEGLVGARRAKLEGLADLLVAYQERLDRARLLDHEDLLLRLLARLRDGPRREGDRFRLVAVDGFADLTQVQERIVQALALRTDRLLVTLPDDLADRETGPFAIAADLRRRLQEGSGLVPEALRTNHRMTGDLARLERLLAGEDVDPAAPDHSAGTQVRFLAGADPADEADRVARTCLGFLTDGIRAGEILVVVRSLAGGTARRVLAALARHRVRARRIGAAPLLEVPLTRSALRLLRLLAARGRPGDLVAALHGGDARGVDTAEADALDTLVRIRGIDGLPALTAAAREAGLPTCDRWLDGLAQAAAPDAVDGDDGDDGERRPPAAVATSLLASLPALLAFSFDGPFPVDVESDGGVEDRIRTDAAAWKRFVGLVRQTATALATAGRGAVTAAELVEAVEAALEDARVAVLDRRVDVVSVVDAEESRQWEARAVVVCGLRMGEFPGGAREDLFVSDHDRAEVAARTGLRLPSRVEAAVRRERMLFYAAATRATERLVLTAPVSDERGEPVLRSPFLERALRILPEDARRLDGEERSPGDLRPAAGEAFHAGDAVHVALSALGARFAAGSDGETRALGGYATLRLLAARDGTWNEDGTEDEPARPLPADHVLVRAARGYLPPRPALRTGGAARAAMARPRARSASSLAAFVQCPYLHFARKGLGLDEAEAGVADGLSPMDAGTLIHTALEQVVRQGVTDPVGAAALFDGIFAEEAGHLPVTLSLVRDRDALRAAVVEFVEARSGASLVPGFVPAYQEWGFGLPGTEARVLLGPEGDQVALSGKVDRLDVEDDDRVGPRRAVVVDYKWSRADRFSNFAAKVEEGVDLQLPLYALAVSRGLGLRPMACGYVTLRDGKSIWLRLADDAPKAGRRDVDWSPAAGGDPEAGLDRVADRIRAIDARIRSGTVALEPRDEHRCGRGSCPFADVCRHEEQP